MNLRPPQALVGIDVANAAKHALIQKQRFDARTPLANPFHKLLFANFKRVRAKPGQFLCKRSFRQIGDAPKPPRVDIAQFATVIQKHANVSVLFARLLRGACRHLSGHSQVHEQRSLLRCILAAIAVRCDRLG